MRPSLQVALLAAVLLAGCGSLPPSRSGPAEAPPSAEAAIQAAQLNDLLGSLTRVVTGAPAVQAEEMARARQNYEQARQGPDALRYALLLAAPVHPARDPVLAQQMLRETLARPELLTLIERALAMVELERINAELRIGAENQRLVSEVQQERERQRGPSSAALTRQLQAANEQNAQLRKALDEARAKLDAIAEFERRQADRPPASEGRNP